MSRRFTHWRDINAVAWRILRIAHRIHAFTCARRDVDASGPLNTYCRILRITITHMAPPSNI